MSSPSSSRMRLSASRSSLAGRQSVTGQSALPRPASSLSANRLTSTQPSYDFLSHGENEQPPAQSFKRSTMRQSTNTRPDASHDEGLRATINALKYEVKTLRDERELIALQAEKENRELQARADADWKKCQVAESAAKAAEEKSKAHEKRLQELQDQLYNEKAALQRQVRDLQDQNASVKEDAEDTRASLSDQERHYKYQLNEVEAKRKALQDTADKVKEEMVQLSQDFETVQARLVERDADKERLEARVAELETQSGNSQELAVIQREFLEQVEHARKLELTNREQLNELRKLREGHKAVQVVEEQKRGLEIQLQVLKDVERQLAEAQLQKEILEDDRRTWTSLLQQDGQEVEYESPEAVVKALVQERIEHATILDRLGNLESETSEKNEIIKSLEAEKEALKDELHKTKTTSVESQDGALDSRALRRLERQRVLAVKEVEYLRAQLKTLDAEETVLLENQNFDSQRAQQIQELQSLVDQYKTEIHTLHQDLSKLESAPPPEVAAPTASEPRGTKRPAESQDPDEDSQLGHLLRKNKNLQIALQKSTQQSKLLAVDLQATKAQLKSLKESKSYRIFELRDNPTAQHEAIKQSTLTTLRQENRDLLAKLQGSDNITINVVPASVVDSLQLELNDKDMVIADKEKRMRRQREIWTDKAAEFRDVIASVLGYRINFQPNGKVKVSSMFHGRRRQASEEQTEDDDEEENYIMFDGENGTMKISGGTEGPFGMEVRELVNFWVKEKKEIPCFLAAMTLEFYEKYSASVET